MPSFSKKGLVRLQTCHRDIQIVCLEVIQLTDFSILRGYSSPEEQFNLFKQGRIENNGVWKVQDKKKIVTYKDGYIKKSKHNSAPSLAIDIAPYPIDWTDTIRFNDLASIVLRTARYLYNTKKITSEIIWGGSWSTLVDLPHFEIK